VYDQEVASSIAGQNDSGQVAHVQVPLSPSHQAECNLVPVKVGVYTGTPRNALARIHGLTEQAGVWLRATETGNQRCHGTVWLGKDSTLRGLRFLVHSVQFPEIS